jgi:hypothetical protein
MSKDNTALIVAAGIAYLMLSKRPAMAAGTVPHQGPMTSLPGNVGTGVGQVLGGALGGLLSGLFSGAKNQYVAGGTGASNPPDWNAAYQENPELLDNVMEYGI